MKRLLKIFSALLVVVWLMAMYNAKFGQDSLTTTTPDILVMGSNPQHRPFSFTQDNQLAGFDIELARILAGRIGKKIVIKQLPEEKINAELSTNVIHLTTQEFNPENDAHDDAHDYLLSQVYVEQETDHVFVVAKNNTELLTLINNALDEMKEDGTVVALKQKWNLI